MTETMGKSGGAPKVSIITPTYNTAHLIGACLASVFVQTYQDFEVLVVNDGSPDTAELERVLAPYMDRIVYIKQPNKRAAGARNTAIARARGEYLAFLDSDDTWLPDHLAAQIRLLAANPALDMVYSDALVVGDESGNWEFMARCPSEGEPTFAALVVERCQVPISTVVVRKSAVVKAGLFDESLARCDDYDLWLRVAFSGARISYSREVQVRLMAGRPGSLGQSNARMAEAYWKILENVARSLPLTRSDRELVQARATEIRARYLYEEGKWQLSECHFEKARELFTEANQHFRRTRLGLAVVGLKIAPQATGKLMALWARWRPGAAV